MTAHQIQELLYGHDPDERIVSIEYARNGTMELLRRGPDGVIASELVPFTPWFVTTSDGARATKGRER